MLITLIIMGAALVVLLVMNVLSWLTIGQLCLDVDRLAHELSVANLYSKAVAKRLGYGDKKAVDAYLALGIEPEKVG